MASYEKDPTTKKWSVRYRVEVNGVSKNIRKRGFERKWDAELWYTTQQRQTEQSTLTFGQLAALYFEHLIDRLKNSSIITFKDVYRVYLEKPFSSLKVDKITPQKVSIWQTGIDKNLSYRYRHKINQICSAMFNYGIKFHKLTINPVKQCGFPRDTTIKKDMQIWTEAEFEQFAASIDNILWKALFTLLYLTGCRRGEALALTWNDFNGRSIKINESINTRGVEGYEVTAPKNSTSNREVLLPAVLCGLLEDYKYESKQIAGWDERAFIFGVHSPICATTITRKFDEYIKKAGVKKIRLHDLRHSHASLLINRGQNILLVAKRLGHSDISRTLNTYSHLFPSQEEALISSLELKIGYNLGTEK